MIKHIDKRAGFRPQAPEPAFNRETETISQYFNPDRAERKVLRYELLAILTQLKKAERNMKWYNRLWRFLRAPLGSGPIEAVPQGEGMTVKGEPAPGREPAEAKGNE